jgi:mannose-6-phosphate isomerase-like protein (cupin superfamily)
MTNAAVPTSAAAAAPAGKYLVDSYEDWAKGEGIPIVTGRAIDLFAVECQPWPRFGVNGAFCHLDGRCDFLTVFLIELPPGQSSAPQRHLYEELCFVLAGRGSTEVQLPSGDTRVLEWGPRSLFTVPMNGRYRHRNEGGEPARFAAVNDLRYLLNLYRNERFIFETPLAFPERGREALCDLGTLVLDAPAPNGLGRSQALTLAGGTIAADVVELLTGTYGQATRQMQGSHLFGVAGEGYTLTWEEGAVDFIRCDWRFGVVTASPGMEFHQHFNAGATPARFLDVQLGSQRFPMFRSRWR